MANINSDPEVTRYLNRPVGAAPTRAFDAMVLAHREERGFGFWACRHASLRPMRVLGFHRRRPSELVS